MALPLPPQFPGRPFLKWAGGKSQLLPQLESRFPDELKSGKLRTYVEPFMGAGAVFFHVMQRYALERAFLQDVNEELCLAWRVVQWKPVELIGALEGLRGDFLDCSELQREQFFYALRERYNAERSGFDYSRRQAAWINRAAQMIFLNKTCFNGLFRTNGSGEFNVPFGRYKQPGIVEPQVILAAARLLKKAHIQAADFEQCQEHVDGRTLVYFDPPYRPLSRTANFNTYSRGGFNDEQQSRLARFFAALHESSAARLMLSNSDPTNNNTDDTFFDELYKPFSIQRLSATRMINSAATKRGAIRELLITNY